jgi:hypothetical protein
MSLISSSDILKFYELQLGDIFKNRNTTPDLKTESGVIKFKTAEIQHFATELSKSIASMNTGALAADISVKGGGGAPGTWTGGTGSGGKIVFSFTINLSSVFGYDLHAKWIAKIKTRVEEAVADYVGSYSWSSLPFGETGTSTHTNSSPGTLTSCKNTKSKLGSVGIVSPGSAYNDIETKLRGDLETIGFVLTKWTEEDMRVLALTLRKVMKDWFDNTEVSNVEASGGVTVAAAGTLSDGKAKGGTFA